MLTRIKSLELIIEIEGESAAAMKRVEGHVAQPPLLDSFTCRHQALRVARLDVPHSVLE